MHDTINAVLRTGYFGYLTRVWCCSCNIKLFVRTRKALFCWIKLPSVSFKYIGKSTNSIFFKENIYLKIMYFNFSRCQTNSVILLFRKCRHIFKIIAGQIHNNNILVLLLEALPSMHSLVRVNYFSSFAFSKLHSHWFYFNISSTTPNLA